MNLQDLYRRDSQDRNQKAINDYDKSAKTPSEKASWTFGQCKDHNWSLEDHLAYGLAHQIQWSDLKRKMMIAQICRMVRSYDPAADRALTTQRAKILGEHLVHATEKTLGMAGITLRTSKSGCGMPISHYSINGSEILMYFGGDRCNPPASENGWAWI